MSPRLSFEVYWRTIFHLVETRQPSFAKAELATRSSRLEAS
jgi:hypothetical protein